MLIKFLKYSGDQGKLVRGCTLSIGLAHANGFNLTERTFEV